jgi:hypothetical protein
METTIRKTRSSGAKRVDDQSSVPGLQTVSRQLPMPKKFQASKPNTAASKMGERKKGNINVAQETMTPAVLVGTADVNEDVESHDNSISPPTEIGPVNSATVEVTVDDVNAKVNSTLRAIEAMDLMEYGDGGDSDKEGFEFDFHNDAVRPNVTLCAAKSDGVSEGAVSDDDLDIEYIDNLGGEACWHMGPHGAKIPAAPDGWSPPGVPKNWCGYINQGKVQVPPPRKTLTTQEIGIFILTHQYMIEKNYVHHKTPAGAIVVPKQPPAGERKVGDWTFHYNGWMSGC